MLEKFEQFTIEKEKTHQVTGGDGREFNSFNTGSNIISSASFASRFRLD